MRKFAGGVTGLSGATLLGFAAVENETPKGDALPILIAVFLIAGTYTLLTSRGMVARFPILRRLPGTSSPASATFEAVDGDTNINLGNQGVGINKGTINVGAPQTVASGQMIATNEKTDEGYVNTLAIHLDHPYAAPSLAVLINRKSVKELRAGPANGGMWSTRDIKSGQGRQGVLLEPPLVSDYRAEVVTDGPQQDLVFEVRVDVAPPVD
jgi:hypothetical protein